MSKEQRRRYEDDLRLAHVLADQVDALTMSRFLASDLVVESKPDLTPVTDADRAAEDIIRTQLSTARPRDSIQGEERGITGHSSRRWILDPIDGTANFVRGVPVWATLIALAEDDEIVMSTISAPALNKRWWATKGAGAFTGRSFHSSRQLQVSKVARVEDAFFSYSSLNGWAARGKLRAFLQLAQTSWRTRAFGDFFSYMLLAEGGLDIAAEPELELWDMAALVPIVTEAGGRFTSFEGVDGPYGGDAIVTNGLMHDEVLELIAQVDD
ncbi:MAG: histidinol-phosphatase [Actinomycetaceae bacterium]|nr:histidinol-phosphatase [Actinomycetaceae bacterium]